MCSISAIYVPVEPLHFMSTTQHVASVFSQLLQGPPAVVQLLYNNIKPLAANQSLRYWST